MFKSIMAKVSVFSCALVLTSLPLFAADPASKLETQEDRESYSIGYQVGPQFFGSWAFPHLYTYDKVGREANGRTNTETTMDLSLGWTKQFNRWATFSLGATCFNVLNSRETTAFDDNIELQAGVTDPDYLKAAGFQGPRSIRAYARWSF